MRPGEIPPLDPAEDFHPGALIAGRFEVDQLMGLWGVGPVYTVREAGAPRLLIIGRLQPGGLPGFLKIGRALSRAEAHPGRLAPIGAGHLGGQRVHLLFERPRGAPLTPGPKRARPTLRLGRALATILEAAPHPVSLRRSLIFDAQRPQVLDLGWGAGLDGVLRGAPPRVSHDAALAALLYAQLTGALPDEAAGVTPAPPSWGASDPLMTYLDAPILRALAGGEGLRADLDAAAALDALPAAARPWVGLSGQPPKDAPPPPPLELQALLE